jgi:hypothetical protein
MTMKSTDEKYWNVIKLLKQSRPLLDSENIIEQQVIRKISSPVVPDNDVFPILHWLFGWANIVWIRRSLITLSFMLVSLFIYQQSIIVKQLNRLNNQIVVSQDKPYYTIRSELAGRIKFLQISGGRLHEKGYTISDEQIESIIESRDKLQTDYNNVMKIIEDDPELKSLIEKRLKELNDKKVKL